MRTGRFFPHITPRFKLSPGARIFTIGSCFARSIEEKLEAFHVPTRQFIAPPSERPLRLNGILNEYNPGTMCQRIEYAQRAANFGSDGIEQTKTGYVDLLLTAYSAPTTMQRLMERRAQIDQLYATLTSCEATIVTLGLVESWYDLDCNLYLNRMPSPLRQRSGSRYELRILDVDDVYALVQRLTRALVAMGVSKIIMTVSPVPLEATFSTMDCVTANYFSKSVLMVCAQRLSREYREVQYFPSFEIATSGGLETYTDDARHVKEDIVDQITAYMIDHFVEPKKSNGLAPTYPPISKATSNSQS